VARTPEIESESLARKTTLGGIEKREKAHSFAYRGSFNKRRNHQTLLENLDFPPGVIFDGRNADSAKDQSGRRWGEGGGRFSASAYRARHVSSPADVRRRGIR